MVKLETILVVDDEPRTREGLKKTLEFWAQGRFSILTAESGQDALHVLESKRISLLITDIRMPEMNGLKLIEAMHDRGQRPVTLIISGYSEFEYAQHALRLGALNYLLKPLTKQKLIDAVEQALNEQAQRKRTTMLNKIVDTKIIELAQEDELAHSPIREALRYIDEQLSTALTLQDVAQQVHLNPSYLSVLFKEQTGLTFREYVMRRRMQNAKHLLVTTTKPIAEIAEEVGYQTAKYFIQLFKEQEGATPSQYRKWMLEQENEI